MLALHTNRLPSEWAQEDPDDIQTVLEIIRDQQEGD